MQFLVLSEEKAPVPKLLLKPPEDQKTVKLAGDYRIRQLFLTYKAGMAIFFVNYQESVISVPDSDFNFFLKINIGI